MKFRNIYKVIGILGLFVILQGRAGGPATVQDLQVTGAPGNGTCANTGCHTQGAFEPTVSMSLFLGANLVAKYDPGITYTLRVINSPIQGIPQRYGFQAVALNSVNAQAGDWGTLAAGQQVATLASKKYVEHSAPAVNGVFEVPWVAPAAGTGTVTFYAASVAANNNGQNTGDGMAKNSLVINENGAGPSSTNNPGRESASMRVLPNPVYDVLNLEIMSHLAGMHKIRIISPTGAVMKTEAVTLQAGVNRTSVPAADLAPGLYLVQLCGEGHLAAVQILKR